MSFTATITSKGQLTLPREIRKVLNTNTVEIALAGDEVRLRPVRSVAGALRKYGATMAPLREIRGEVWEEATRAKKS
jgi:AbrB family looped-hinge helix DNA binding protein